MAELQYPDASRIPHALIVTAPGDGESEAAARQIAAALVCQSAGPVPCGRCAACRKVRESIHPDVIFLRRELNEDGKPKQNISVEQVRAMAADACVLPNESRRKVYIVCEAERMNLSAQNAALKLLEEPPEGVHFLLCTTNAGLLLPTVRSRCGILSLETETGEKSPWRDRCLDYLRAVAARDRMALLRWCNKNEGLETRQGPDFFQALQELLADMLCAREDSLGLDRETLLRLSGLCLRCLGYLRVNVSVKQLFGLLAVDSLPARENRGLSID